MIEDDIKSAVHPEIIEDYKQLYNWIEKNRVKIELINTGLIYTVKPKKDLHLLEYNGDVPKKLIENLNKKFNINLQGIFKAYHYYGIPMQVKDLLHILDKFFNRDKQKTSMELQNQGYDGIIDTPKEELVIFSEKNVEIVKINK